jgi:hypothetical protein
VNKADEAGAAVNGESFKAAPPYCCPGISLFHFWLLIVLFFACVFRFVVITEAGNNIEVLAAFLLNAAKAVDVIQFTIQATFPKNAGHDKNDNSPQY